ncbi:MAG: L-lactate permease [Gemmatimonadota bacterium]
MIPLLAALPILAILLLMLWQGWSAARAGGVGVAIALASALLVFDLANAAGPARGLGDALAGTVAEAGFTAVTILWIIGPALGIHELQLRTGAANVLRSALAALAPDPRFLALLVGWFFVLFMEGAAGFGSSVALAAPFLVSAGFRPVPAVTLALIGHAVGVSFGAIGTPIVPQVAATGLAGAEIARATGIYHSLLGWVPLTVMMLLVRRSAPDPVARGGIWGWTAAAFLCFAIPYTLLWAFVGPELPTLGGALFGGLLFVLLLRLGTRRGRRADRETDFAAPPLAVARAAAPYLVLVAVVLVTRMVPPLRTFLQGLDLRWDLWDAFGGSIQILYHPGTTLLVGFVVGAWLQRATVASIAGAFLDTTRRLLPVTLALFAMLLLSRLMVHSGMTDVLATSASAAAGRTWPGLAPFVGMLGTFVTGSATASNILFTDFHRETAIALGLPVVGVVGAQGFGAAVGNMICPHNVVAAGATVGLEGREGEILKGTLWVTLLYASLGGTLALWLVR